MLEMICSRRMVRALVPIALAASTTWPSSAHSTQDAASLPTGDGAPLALVASGDSFPDASFVVEEMRTVYRFESDGTGTKSFRVRARVQDEAGVSAFGRVVVPYAEAFDSASVEYVRVRKPDGSVVEADPDEFQDRSEAAPAYASVYTDARQLHVPVPSLRPGDVVEFRTVVTTHTPQIPGHFWIEDVFLDEGVVLQEVIEVDVPSDREVKILDPSEAEHEVVREGDRTIHRWRNERRETGDGELEDLDRRLQEALRRKPDVLVSSFGTWEEVGDWFGLQVAAEARPTTSVRARTDSLTEGLTSDREKARAIYREVASEIRYVALLLGRGRYRPHAPDEVLRNGYGDCKDKHTLLAAMLRAVGIEARPVLIHSQRDELLDVPSPSQFDHMITMVPLEGDTLWLDATSGVAPFDFLPAGLRDKRALVATSGRTSVVRTPDRGSVDSFESIEFRGKLTETGRATGQLVIRGQGDPGMTFRMVFRRLPRSVWDRAIEQMLGAMGIPGEVGDTWAGDPTELDSPFSFGARLTLPEALQVADGQARLSLPLPDQTAPDPPEGAEADTVELGTRLASRRVVALQIPDDVEVDLPLGITLERPYAAYRSGYRADADSLRIERTFTILAPGLGSARPGDYVAFLNALRSDEAQAIELRLPQAMVERVREGEAAEEADRLAQEGYELVEAEDFADAESVLRRAVELNPDHLEAWNNLGRSLLGLGRVEEAEEAFRRQLDVAPFHDHAHNNLGLALQRQERIEEAEDAFRRQLDVVPLHEYANANLGGLLARSGREEQALTYLERGLKLTPENESLKTRYGLTLMRAGRHEEAADVLRETMPRLADRLGDLDETSGKIVVQRAAPLEEVAGRAVDLLRQAPGRYMSLEMVVRLLPGESGSEEQRERLLGLVREEPGNAGYRHSLACVLFYRAQTEEGLEHALEAVRLEPDEPFYWITVGRLQYLNGSRTFALSAYRRARELDPSVLEASPEDHQIYRELEGG